jgi:peptide/nickel transport system substrate-binding protein
VRLGNCFGAGLVIVLFFAFSGPLALVSRAGEERLVVDNALGRPGGRIVVALRAEPKTLNPVLAVDAPSRDVIRGLTADLIHINRATQRTEPALAKSWSVSRDGRQYTVRLRQGLRFSDGSPFSADDVVFSFQVYLDQNIHSPQRDLLIVGGKPLTVRKLNDYAVRFELAQPYAAAERIFDSLAMLPKHRLENAYRAGNFSQEWNLTMSPSKFASMGPFRLKGYVPGQEIELERNPYYWKEDRKGNRLPYLDQVVFQFVPSEDAQVIRFESRESDILTRLSAENFSVLQKQEKSRGYQLYDLGPGLEYNFLFFNLNDISLKDLGEIAKKQAWFRDVRFRRAVSAAIDREGIVRLVFKGRATPLWGNVTPGNRLWVDEKLPHPPQSVDHARELLREAGFSWNHDGALVDAHGDAVEFSILVSSSNAERIQIATIIQEDLSHLGMHVHLVSLEFRSVVDRLLKTHDFEACIMGLTSGDADPNPEMNVWLSGGATHLWHTGETQPATPWEAEIDRLMQQQLVTLDYARRKDLYDRVQEIVSEQVPVICLVSPNILVAAMDRVGNFQPAILDPYALWNVDQLYVH